MELFRNLRIKAGRSMLAKRYSKILHKPSYKGFGSIKGIGIVWDATNPEELAVLAKFHQKMSEAGKQVRVIGLFPGKVLPDQYVGNRFMVCLKNNETDFFYRPDTIEAEAFMKEKFDLLIDINPRDHFPLFYISSLSKASLKVGLAGNDPGTSPFDLMISMRNPVNVDKYLEQVLLYLEMINPETVKKAV